MKKMDDHNS